MCLIQKGVDEQKRIVDAWGHYPVLRNVDLDQIELFRAQCKLLDYAGESDIKVICTAIDGLDVRETEPFAGKIINRVESEMEPSFKKLKPGGQRDPIVYDPNGFFVIALDRDTGEIVVRHYLPDNTPAHEMRGRRAESVLLGLLREELISQMSHAGYLGIELAKAETALRLDLPYEQDQPIRD
jgi:tetrahydromethanopterin S-methyltransferase subunit A